MNDYADEKLHCGKAQCSPFSKTVSLSRWFTYPNPLNDGELVVAAILLLYQSHAFASLSHFSQKCHVHLVSVSESGHDDNHKGNDENNKHNHKCLAEMVKNNSHTMSIQRVAWRLRRGCSFPLLYRDSQKVYE